MTTTPAQTPLTLQEGHYYRTRDGQRVGPMRPWAHDEGYPWTEDEEGNLYSPEGKRWGCSMESNASLIEEWAEPSATDNTHLDLSKIEPLPPVAPDDVRDVANLMAYSQAVSLKRIAATLEAIEDALAMLLAKNGIK